MDLPAKNKLLTFLGMVQTKENVQNMKKAKDIFAAHYQLHLQYKYITRSGVCGNIHREL